MSVIKPVTETEQFAHDAAVIARINAAERRRSITDIVRWVVVAVCIPAAASGWVAWAKYPLVVKEERFVPISEDGTRLMALRDADLPPQARKRDVQNSIINYVRKREGFNDLEVDKNWDVVSRMSSIPVRDEYQAINSMNKDGSQWKTYSGGGWIKISYDSMEDLTTPAGYTDIPPAYFVRFCRQVKRKDKSMPDRAELWGATVGFKADVPGYDVRLIVEENPGKIQVTSYPDVRPIGPLVNENGTPKSGCGVMIK